MESEPALGEGFDVLLGISNHDVCLQRQLRHLTQRANDHRTDRDVRDEVSVHDVDVNAVRPGKFSFFHMITETRRSRRRESKARSTRVVLSLPSGPRLPFGRSARQARPAVGRMS